MAQGYTDTASIGRISETLDQQRLGMPSKRQRYLPVSIAADPVSLVISECISVTSALQKHARSTYSSVAAILGGGGMSHLGLSPPGQMVRERTQARPKYHLVEEVRDMDSVKGFDAKGNRTKMSQESNLMSMFGKLRHELSDTSGTVYLSSLIDVAPSMFARCFSL